MKWNGMIIKYLVRFLVAVDLLTAWALWARADGVPSTPLTMPSAIERAIQTNVTTQLAKAGTDEARGRVLQAAASLLPQVTASASQSRVFKTNLAAQGLQGTLLPNPVIGPYNVFDARFELVEKILDVNAIWNTKAAAAHERAAQDEENLAAEQVASAAALAYIEDARALRHVTAAQANLALAQRLANLANHQHETGVATGVDVARAETSVAQNQQDLIQAKLAATLADVRLKRVVGIPLTEPVVLSSSAEVGGGPIIAVGSPPTTAGNDDKFIAQALTDRVEIQIIKEQVQAETYALDAAKANHLPTVSAAADYGFSGNLPDGSARTGSIGGQLNLPIFSGGAIHGQVVEHQGLLNAAQSFAADTRIQVEEDVRVALETLSAEVDDVNTAETQMSLAERELKLSEDRYREGAGDNIQVVTAQTSVADSRRTQVDAQARYQDAKANLASALGHMRTFEL